MHGPLPWDTIFLDWNLREGTPFSWITDYLDYKSVITLRQRKQGRNSLSGVTDFSCSHQYLADFLTVSYIQYTLRIISKNIKFSREGRGVCLLEFHPVTVLFWIALLQSPSRCHSRSLKDVLMLENYCELYHTKRFKGKIQHN